MISTESVKPAMPTKEEVERALKTILACPDLLDKLLQTKEQEKNRRKNWSRLSVSAYYCKRYALELKQVIDDMVARNQDMEYCYADYPNLKAATLYMRINHGKLFLIDELDTEDFYYKNILRRIQITRCVTGVRLTLVPFVDDSIVPRPISHDEKKDTWKEKVDKYVEKAKPGDEPLHLKGLSLTQDEVNGLKESFIALEHIGAIVLPNEIKIMVFGKGPE